MYCVCSPSFPLPFPPSLDTGLIISVNHLCPCTSPVLTQGPKNSTWVSSFLSNKQMIQISCFIILSDLYFFIFLLSYSLFKVVVKLLMWSCNKENVSLNTVSLKIYRQPHQRFTHENRLVTNKFQRHVYTMLSKMFLAKHCQVTTVHNQLKNTFINMPEVCFCPEIHSSAGWIFREELLSTFSRIS